MKILEGNGKATADHELVSDQPTNNVKMTWAYGRMAVAASLAAILATSGLLYQTHTLDQRERHWRAEKTTFLDKIETLKGAATQATRQIDITSGVRDQFLNELGIARVQIMDLENQLLARNREIEQVARMIIRDHAAFAEAQGQIASLLEERKLDAVRIAAERQHLEQGKGASTAALQIIDRRLATTRIALSNARQEIDDLKRDLKSTQGRAPTALTSFSWREIVPAIQIKTK